VEANIIFGAKRYQNNNMIIKF